MKPIALFILISIFNNQLIRAQDSNYAYAPSNEHPFGILNPDAPKEVGDYAKLIGECDCKSYVKNTEGGWAEPIDMIWTFKYIMNGMAVQDGTLKADGGHSGSIRQYLPDSARWYVHYFSQKALTPVFRVWQGGFKNNEIILYNEQPAPNGTEGFFKIRFYDINDTGYKWIGTWVTPDESFKLETWKINCVKRIDK